MKVHLPNTARGFMLLLVLSFNANLTEGQADKRQKSEKAQRHYGNMADESEWFYPSADQSDNDLSEESRWPVYKYTDGVAESNMENDPVSEADTEDEWLRLIDLTGPVSDEDWQDAYKQPLHRRKRDLSWSDVEAFYADKNNFAMYLVLPIIVLVYGGCAVIYCIARCRRYAKRKKKKPKNMSEPLTDNEPEASQSGLNPVVTHPGGAEAREGAFSSSEVRVDMEQGETSLPWQVPGDKQPLYNNQKPGADTHYHNRGYIEDLDNEPAPRAAPDRTTTAPPPYEETDTKNLIRPPPYIPSNKIRRESVEEVIALETPRQTLSRQDRKRRRPGSRSSEMLPPLPEPNYDEERERARQLVRGDRPKRERDPDQDRSKERTPDIISHARTKPLTPKYRPPRDDLDGAAMAKQAAQLLRLDHQGKQQGKKQKRLVFVAE